MPIQQKLTPPELLFTVFAGIAYTVFKSLEFLINPLMHNVYKVVTVPEIKSNVFLLIKIYLRVTIL